MLSGNMNKKIGIQGEHGSFHHEVSEHCFGRDAEIVSFSSFYDLIESLSNGQIDVAIMAIENSIAGSIMYNYVLLDSYPVQIVHEVFWGISHNLLANHGTKMDEVKEILSHPMALAQCQKFLGTISAKHRESTDTAAAANILSNTPSKDLAVIASKYAAEIYNLQILATDIQDAQDNWTRFLILEKGEAQVVEHQCEGQKLSIQFKLADKVGSLFSALEIIKDFKMNMSKLQSFTIPGKKFEYGFFVDLQSTDGHQFSKLLEKLKEYTNDLKILGVYPADKI